MDNPEILVIAGDLFQIGFQIGAGAIVGGFVSFMLWGAIDRAFDAVAKRFFGSS